MHKVSTEIGLSDKGPSLGSYSELKNKNLLQLKKKKHSRWEPYTLDFRFCSLSSFNTNMPIYKQNLNSLVWGLGNDAEEYNV